MLDNITVDQLRVFIAAAEEGSFSAAGRKLHKVQSAISYSISNLEESLGIDLFDRSKRSPKLTTIGETMLKRAKIIVSQIEQLHQHALSVKQGMETDLSLCTDPWFPTKILFKACAEFKFVFPNIPLSIYTEPLDVIKKRISQQRCHLGFACTLDSRSAHWNQEELGSLQMICAVSSKHILGQKETLVDEDLLDELQILVTHTNSSLPNQTALSNKSWTVNSFISQREILKSGLGWGLIPKHMIAEDIKKKILVEIKPESLCSNPNVFPLIAMYRQDVNLGPSALWLLKKLEYALQKQDH